MENHENVFNVRMIEEYLFCPAVFYYKYYLGINREPGLWSTLGLDVQEELSRYVEEEFKVIDKQVYLESRRYRLAGIVDYLVEYNGEETPLEIKYSRRLKPWWRYTLVAYALLVEEEHGKPVKAAILVIPGPEKIIINITDSDRRYIEKILEDMEKILNEGEEPKPAPSKSCINCDYKDICIYKQYP